MGGFGSLAGEVDREEAELKVSCGRGHVHQEETCPYCDGRKVWRKAPEPVRECMWCGKALLAVEWVECVGCKAKRELEDECRS